MSDETKRIQASELGLKNPDKTELNAEIVITPHPPDEGFPLAARLNQSLGPVMADMFAVDESASPEAQAVARLNALKSTYSAIEPEKLLPLAKSVLKYTRVIIPSDEDKPVILSLSNQKDFSSFFHRRYGALYPLMLEAIRVNDFLELDAAQLILG